MATTVPMPHVTMGEIKAMCEKILAIVEGGQQKPTAMTAIAGAKPSSTDEKKDAKDDAVAASLSASATALSDAAHKVDKKK